MMYRRDPIALLVALLLTIPIGSGCDREASRPDDEPETPSESAGERAGAQEDDADQNPYQQLGHMYDEYAGACPDDGEPSGPLCGSEAAEQMARQMMHMHENYAGWGHHPPRDRMPMHGRSEMEGKMGERMKGDMRGRGDDDRRGSMGPGWHASAMDMWHRQMANRHEQMAAQMREAGDEELAERHRDMMERHHQMAESFEGAEADEREEAPSAEEDPKEAGRQLYASSCAACHGENGEGVSGAFPPLADGPVVPGDPERLTRIVAYGLQGPIEIAGEVYNGVMPGFQDRLSNAQIAAILTYIRDAWHEDASAISPETVEAATEEAPDTTTLSPAALELAP